MTGSGSGSGSGERGARLSGWAHAYRSIGLHAWPGYIEGRAKIPNKAPHLWGRRVSAFEHFTTEPEGGDGWTRWDAPTSILGHIPALARVPVLVVDLDSDRAVEAWRGCEGQPEGAETMPTVQTGRGLHALYRAPAWIAELAPERRPTVAEPEIPGTRVEAGWLAGTAAHCEVLGLKFAMLPPSRHPGGGWYRRAGLWGSGSAPPIEEWPLAPSWATEPLRHYVGAARSTAAPGTAATARRIEADLGDADDVLALARRMAGSRPGGRDPRLTAALEELGALTTGEGRHPVMLTVTRLLAWSIAFRKAGAPDLDLALAEWERVTRNHTRPRTSRDAAREFADALRHPLAEAQAAALWSRARAAR